MVPEEATTMLWTTLRFFPLNRIGRKFPSMKKTDFQRSKKGEVSYERTQGPEAGKGAGRGLRGRSRESHD